MAKKLPMVHCRLCNGEIDRNADPEEKEWLMTSKNYFYHRSCYNNWKKAQREDDEDYVDLIYDYIARDLKESYNWWVCETQRKKFIKENKMTNKGILFALKYFYEVKHGDWSKGHGGIGIVPFIYSDSCAYWAARERQSEGLIKEIERQMLEAINRPKIHVKKKERKKKVIDFSILDNLEEDE